LQDRKRWCPHLFGANLSNDASCGTGAGMIVLPVGIGDLADNGGPTKTHALLLGSPAIDAGTSCTEATDQRRVARNQGSSCDIGAFEFTDFATLTVTMDPNIAVNAKTGAATVTGDHQLLHAGLRHDRRLVEPDTEDRGQVLADSSRQP
jgi:hypothetical protein